MPTIGNIAQHIGPATFGTVMETNPTYSTTPGYMRNMGISDAYQFGTLAYTTTTNTSNLTYTPTNDTAAQDTSLTNLFAQGMGAPTIQVYSREVVVDVEVMDANGRPVHGLTQADITVRENGKEQAVRSFAEYDGCVELVCG